ncbi:enhanced intracellular survival protein Eis [Terribacillus saccharophilus]|uniref:GNAT family N-acetyltransferase n=1 Tax=Terribacillus saccharophilus TaxID=361277 RepID=UPI003800072B
MQTERLQKQDLEAAMQMSEYAFRYRIPEDKRDARLEQMDQHQQLYGIKENGKLAAKLQLLPLSIRLGEQTMLMGGIAGVATYPEYRRNGYIKRLLTDTLYHMRDQGMPVSMLHPFYVDFYRRFGYELFTDRTIYTLKKKDLNRLNPVDGTIERMKKEEHTQEIEDIYTAYAATYSGMLAREDFWWKYRVYRDHDFIALYRDSDGKAQGYIIYEISSRDKLDVSQFIALNAEARIGLWNFLAQHDSMFEEVTLDLPQHDPLIFMLPDPQLEVKHYPYFMARILDVPAFFEKYDWQGSPAGVVLHVEDPIIQENNDTFTLKDANTEMSSEAKGIKLSINMLSAIAFGYKRPLVLWQAGLIEGPEEMIRKFELSIPRRKPYIYDFF